MGIQYSQEIHIPVHGTNYKTQDVQCIKLQTTEDPLPSVGRMKKANSKDYSDDKRSRTFSVSKAKGRPGPKSAKAKPGPASSSRSSKRSTTPDNDVNGDEDGSDSGGDPFQANDEEDPLDVTPRKQK